MSPHHLLQASGVPAFTLQQGGWVTVHKRQFVLKNRYVRFIYITP